MDGAMEWLASGERGTSSDTMFSHLTGIDASRHGYDHPYDPADFQRCERLLRAVPELRDSLPRMSELGPVWSAFVEHWDELVQLLEYEVPGVYSGLHGRAPMTYEIIRDIRDGRNTDETPSQA